MITFDELQPYINEDGMIHGRPNNLNSDGNQLLFTAEVLACGGRFQFLPFILKHEVEPGLFHRTPPGRPFHFDQEQVDDYTGLGVIAVCYNPAIARRILSYGRKHKYKGIFKYLYETEPGAGSRAWLGRFPALITHLEWAAGEKPNWLRRLAWAYAVAGGPKKGDKDSWILSWLMTVVYELREKQGNWGWLENWAMRKRLYRLKEAYPEHGLPGVLADYFMHWHPIALHCEDT